MLFAALWSAMPYPRTRNPSQCQGSRQGGCGRTGAGRRPRRGQQAAEVDRLPGAQLPEQLLGDRVQVRARARRARRLDLRAAGCRVRVLAPRSAGCQAHRLRVNACAESLLCALLPCAASASVWRGLAACRRPRAEGGAPANRWACPLRRAGSMHRHSVEQVAAPVASWVAHGTGTTLAGHSPLPGLEGASHEIRMG